MNANELRDGIFALQTRRFGTVAEVMIQRMLGFAQARLQFHDLFDDIQNRRVEVKFSRAFRTHDERINQNNVMTAINDARGERRAISEQNLTNDNFDCNIQQIKCTEFDVLYYGIFFNDCVVIFRVASSEVKSIEGYSDKQHKGNVGEGQFHINQSNYSMHKRNFFYAQLTYDELKPHLEPEL